MNASHFNFWFPLDDSRRSLVVRYCGSLAVVVGAILARLWLDPALDRSGFLFVLIGMLVTAWLGGLGPSVIAQALVLVTELYWFSEKRELPNPFMIRGFVTYVAFFGVGWTVGLLSNAWRAARKRELAERNEALAQHEQLCATLSCVADGVLVTDAEARLTMMNPVAESITGWTFAEVTGKPVRDVFAICDEQSQDPIENPVHRVLREGQVLQETMRLMLTTHNEQCVPVSFSAAPIHDGRGKTTGVVLIFRDETERRRTEIALRDADQRKDEFLATLAHELRNPLAPICAGLELMKFSAADPAATQEVRSMMDRQTKQMVRLIDDLLDVSRITRGKLELRRSQVRLEDVVRNAVEATRPAITEAEHQLFVHLPQRPVLLDADPHRLTQVLSNLLNNAAKYTPRRGRIELIAEDCDGELAIVVKDNGRGIPPEKLPYVFEMFTQVHGGAECDPTGLGIGLTLVKRLVELHGGTVEVKSSGQDSGTEFRLQLPAIKLPTVVNEWLPAAADQQPARGVSCKVLVVDDNDDALDSLSLLVKLMGNEVAKARDGLEAIETAEQWRPEIVLMDLGMPRLNGYEAARRIREQPWGAEMMLVAITGWGQDEDRRQTAEAGFDRHLVKPVEMAAVQALLASCEPATAQHTSNAAASAGPDLPVLAASRVEEVADLVAAESSFRPRPVPK